MPMAGYVAMHAEAKLTDAEKKQLGEAFIAMFGSEKTTSASIDADAMAVRICA